MPGERTATLPIRRRSWSTSPAAAGKWTCRPAAAISGSRTTAVTRWSITIVTARSSGSFGKTDRAAADGFGGCCEPKNLRFAGDDLFACESGPPTCVNASARTASLGVVLIAPWTSGCVRVTTEYDAAKDRFFVLNSDERTIHVFARKAEGNDSQKTTSLRSVD